MEHSVTFQHIVTFQYKWSYQDNWHTYHTKHLSFVIYFFGNLKNLLYLLFSSTQLNAVNHSCHTVTLEVTHPIQSHPMIKPLPLSPPPPGDLDTLLSISRRLTLWLPHVMEIA